MSTERKKESDAIDIIKDLGAQYFITRYISSMLRSAAVSKADLLCYQNLPEEKENMIDFLPAFKDEPGRYGGVTTASTNLTDPPRIVVCLSKLGEQIFKESLKNEIEVEKKQGQSAYKKIVPMRRATAEAEKNALEEMKILGNENKNDIIVAQLNRFTQRLDWDTLSKICTKAQDERKSDKKIFEDKDIKDINISQKQLYAAVEKQYKKMIPDEKTGKIEFKMSHIDSILDDLNCNFSLSRKKGFIKKVFGNDFYKAEKDKKLTQFADTLYKSFGVVSPDKLSVASDGVLTLPFNNTTAASNFFSKLTTDLHQHFKDTANEILKYITFNASENVITVDINAFKNVLTPPKTEQKVTGADLKDEKKDAKQREEQHLITPPGGLSNLGMFGKQQAEATTEVIPKIDESKKFR